MRRWMIRLVIPSDIPVLEAMVLWSGRWLLWISVIEGKIWGCFLIYPIITAILNELAKLLGCNM